MSGKLIQLEAVQGKDNTHVLYGLDDQGEVWLYDSAQRVWLAAGTERMVPQSLHGGHPA